MKNSSSKKRRIAASALAVVLAAALLVGATLSYYGDNESIAVANDLEHGVVEVDISETDTTTDDDGNEVKYYKIIPGTEADKDPTITLTATVDSYVFLVVEDASDGLVTYALLEAWTPLFSSTDEDGTVTTIYYQSKGTSTDENGNYLVQTLGILKENSISYSASITNNSYTTETNESGDTIITLNGDYSLTFWAYAIQSGGFDCVEEAYLALFGEYSDGYYLAEEDNYDSDSETDTVLSVTVYDTTIANSETDEDGNPTVTSTTVTVTIPEGTTLTTSSDTSSDDSDEDSEDDSSEESEDSTATTEDSEITSLTLKVKKVYSADSTDILGDTSYAVGDYTFDISLVDQDGNAVSATSGYIEIAIQAATGLRNYKVYHDGEKLGTTATTDGTAYYKYATKTGIFTIYTQSFSEFEICWRGTTSTTISTAYLQGSYSSSSTSTQTSTATVTTTLANSASSESEYTTTTTFKASVSSGTVLTSSTGEITSLYPVVTDETSSTTAVVPGGDAGDYTFDISLIDQDANEVTATNGYIVITIAAKSDIENLTVTKLEDGEDETAAATTLGTAKTTDGSDYYTYTSSTGALKIYTQSPGEYEIYWNDTGIGMEQITSDSSDTDLLKMYYKNNKYYTTNICWMFTVDSSVSAINSNYSDWLLDIVLIPNTNMSDCVTNIMAWHDGYKYNNTYVYYNMTKYMLSNYFDEAFEADKEFCLLDSFAQLTTYSDVKYKASLLTDTAITTSSGSYTGADCKFRVGLITTGGSGTAQLRIYETDSDGNRTGKYLILQSESFNLSSGS